MTEVFIMPFANGRIADVWVVDIFPQMKQLGMSQS